MSQAQIEISYEILDIGALISVWEVVSEEVECVKWCINLKEWRTQDVLWSEEKLLKCSDLRKLSWIGWEVFLAKI